MDILIKDNTETISKMLVYHGLTWKKTQKSQRYVENQIKLQNSYLKTPLKPGTGSHTKTLL